jgi:hypothetical protein
VEITPTSCPGCTRDSVVAPTAYRVVLWEQPNVEGVHPESIGWGETAFDLSGVGDVREVVRWAEDQLASGAGAYSQAGRAVRDREYVVYASVEVLGEVTLVQVAGLDPTRGSGGSTQVVLRRRS